jgi:O-antigen/teichoic acid export membrane protein
LIKVFIIADPDTLNRQHSIARSVAWNYLGIACESLAGLVLIGYVVRRISVAEYGLLLLAMSLCSMMFLLDLGLSNLLVQAYIAAAKDSWQKLSDLLSTAFVALTALGTLGLLVFGSIALNLPGPFKIPHEYIREASIVFILVAIATQLSLPTMALEYVYQAFHRFDRINQVQVVTATVRIVLTVVLLAAGYGVVALAFVQTLLSLSRLLLLLIALRWSVPGVHLDIQRFDWNLLKPLLRPGGWAALDNSVRQLASISDSFILGVFGSMGSVALFGIGGKLPTQLSNVVTRGAIVILPSLAKHHADADLRQLRRVYLNAQKLVFTGVLPAVVLGCLCARPLIQVWAGTAYIGAAAVMQWLLLATFSLAMEYSSDLLLYACGEIKTAARIATFESVANVAVSLMLVSHYGALGLAAGTAITHIVINVFWYTPAACRAAGIRTSELVREMIAGHAWPFVLLIMAVLIISLAWLTMPPVGVLIVAVISGIAYFAMWGIRTAIPMWRLRAEMAE